MPDDRADQELLSAYRAGDEQAAEVLFSRYYQRLVGQARKSLGISLARMEEPSDLAQSVFRSVFRRGREKKIHIEYGDNLWPLLATATVNKVRTRARYWQRQRRDVRRNVVLDEGLDPLEHGPTPEDVVATTELISQLLEQFSPKRRAILELLLQGYRGREVADQVGVSERTVYSTRKAAEEVLRQLDDEADAE